jgi:uncharacterized protein
MAEILIPISVLALLVMSQVFWIRRVREVGRKLISRADWRDRAAAVGLTLYAFIVAYNLVPFWWTRSHSPVQLTWHDAALNAPFMWWVFASLIGFLFVVILRLPLYLWRGLSAAYAAARRKASSVPAAAGRASSRRRFLEQATVAVGVVPFVSAFYGLVRERVDIETTHYRVAFSKLPRGFQGFRIAQVSDLHIGPFMSAAEIRHCAEMTNALKPDLILLTGDYVTWDGSTQYAAVDALSGLKAPYGVIGTLGNHEMWTHTEDSITRLFEAQGTRILRSANATLRAGADELNIIGVDYQSRRAMGHHEDGMVRHYLQGIEPMVRRDTVNILMTHNPNAFDRAAELGIELSLAGHTHGGQVTMEFISPDIAPSRLVTPYVVGWFSKPGGRLYVNRGIGTIGVPMRIDAPPEITVYELEREA